MALTFFNTLGRKFLEFKHNKRTPVTLYTCGPTVYRSPHIGNYRTYLFEDVLKRVLLLNGFDVTHVMNITDVGHIASTLDEEGGDKIAQESIRLGKNAWELARHYEDEFKKELSEFNILSPTLYPRATEHITEQIELIKKLEKKGFTYRTSDGIYFDTSKDKEYGKLAPRDLKKSLAGKRITLKEKRNPTDFALWKFSEEKGLKRQMEWKSPWGIGYPGWHIECSAMAIKYLGPKIDIHCGAVDLAETHHPNEIAQSEAATGKKPFSKLWMHAAFLNVRGEKMAKSSPETNITVDILKQKNFSPLDFRYLTLGTHYRKPLSFSWEALGGARNARLKLLRGFSSLKEIRPKKTEAAEKKQFLSFVNNDLNTPKALAFLLSEIHKGASKEFVLWADHVLGLNIKKELENLLSPNETPYLIQELARKREGLRKEKLWEEADKVRRKIEKEGWRIEDTPDGFAIHKL